MKKFILFISIFISLHSFAQNNSIVTATLSVRGNCEECKNRIENAADIKNVKLAVWDEAKQILTVTYKSDKVTLEQIEKKIASSGHDTGNLKGDDLRYKKLPSCCKYRDKKCELK